MDKIKITTVERTVNKAVFDTFDAMLSMNLEQVGKKMDPNLNDQRLVGAVNFAGEAVGTLSLHISQAFAKEVTASMLGIETEEIESEEEVKDVLGELTNIISGHLKSDFTDMDLACVISTPSITHGSDFKLETAEVGEFRQWIYRHKENEIIVEISLKEDLGNKLDVHGEEVSAHEVLAMINSVDVPTTVINSVIDVFYTMLSMELDNIPAVPENFREEKRTVGTVSFAGDVDGLFNIQVNDKFARIMTAAMLGMEEDEVVGEEEIFDVIREMSNIIGGNLKSTFVDAGLKCVLSVPSLANGLDFRVEALNIIQTQRFLFKYQDHTIIVDAGIKKDESAESRLADATGEVPEEEAPAPEEASSNLDLIMGIPLEVTVELGTTKKRVRELLKMGQGSVVGLSQLEGEPVDLLVNDTLVAKGEVQVDKEKYGIRIVEVVSRKVRVNSFK